MKKLLFIFNPHTGGNRLSTNLVKILCHLSGAGYLLTVCPTGAQGDAERLAAKNAAGHDLVVCCGGDGTLNEVVCGLMQLESPPAVGYIPGGTTNDFASSLHLPKADMLAAARRAVHPRRVLQCDIGLLNDRHFTYVAAFGAFTDVPYKTRQNTKNLLGYAAYLLEGIQRLPSIKSYPVEITEGEEHFEEELIFGMVSNSTSVAGYSFVGQESVSMNDGIFEMLLIKRPHNIADLGAISAALLRHKFDSPYIIFRRVTGASFSGPQAIPWTVDGEFGGELAEAQLKILPGALRIHT